MMPSQRETSEAKLLDQINAISSSDRENEFLLKGLERRAEQLLSVDALAGYTVLGALAAIRQDIPAVKANHDKALRMSSTAPDVLRNYAVSLSKAGAVDDAIVMARRAWELDRSQSDNLSLLVQLNCEAGHMTEAARRAHEALQIPKLSTQWHHDIAGLKDAASLLADRGVGDPVTSAIAREALKIARPLSVKRVISCVTTDDESKWVDFAVAVQESTEKVAELNQQLAARMAEFALDEDILRAIHTFVVRFTSRTDACHSH
jgi:hypothetical protein